MRGAILPPMDALRPLASGLWVADRPLPLAVGDIGARMTVVRLDDGGLLLHSPIKLDDATRAALDALGPVRAVVAPCLPHHFFVKPYLAQYPEARSYAAPGLPERRKDLRFDAVLGDEAPAQWRGQLDQLVVRGAPFMNEVALLHRASRTLVLTDLVFNVPHEKRGPARLFYWLVGAAGRFGPHRVVRLGIRDRAAARRSLDALLAWDFDRVVMSHGDVLEVGGKDRLRDAFAFLP